MTDRPETPGTRAFRQARITAAWDRLSVDDRIAFRDELGDGEEIPLALVHAIEERAYGGTTSEGLEAKGERA